MALVPRYRVPLWAKIASSAALVVYSTLVGLLVALDRYGKASWPVVHNGKIADSSRRVYKRVKSTK